MVVCGGRVVMKKPANPSPRHILELDPNLDHEELIKQQGINFDTDKFANWLHTNLPFMYKE